jgi:hypothetical protein
MHSQLDRKAAAFVCLKHHTLRGELESLQSRYDFSIEYAKTCAMRIEETQSQLDALTMNIDQIFCDALDALGTSGVEDAPVHAGKAVHRG